MTKKIIITIISCFILSILSVTVFAQDIKTRMKERLPIINTLKADGIIGENNKGFLEFVGGKQDRAETVKAENTDRAAVYEAIAKQQNTTSELVGKRRALQIVSEVAKPGEWVQDSGGKWVKK